MMDNMIEVRDLQVTLSGKTIVQHMNADIPNGKITAIIGPNGCGKSTTLKAICRINPISAGQITLLNRNVWDFGYKEFAQKLAILTQSPQAPADMTVRDLVAMGRFPYRSLFGKATKEDQECMQKPQVLLLDEPTTYLDICHQLEVMKLLDRLNRELKLTVALVLHDLNQAVQFAHHVVVMKKGTLVTSGNPADVITVDLLKEVFRVKAEDVYTSDGVRTLVPLDLY